jgi:hypothetical protein
MRGPWNQAYDLDALRTMEQKALYLGRAAAERWWVSFAHDDRVCAARIMYNGGRLAIEEALPIASRDV